MTRYAEVRRISQWRTRVGPNQSGIRRRLARSENADHRRVLKCSQVLGVYRSTVHTRLRSLLSTLSDRAIARMEDVVQVLIDELVEELGERSSCDFLTILLIHCQFALSPECLASIGNIMR